MSINIDSKQYFIVDFLLLFTKSNAKFVSILILSNIS